MSSTHPPTVAIIGGGPGGLFFCHVLEHFRRDLEEKGESTEHIPIVTCFERAAGPGGVWRSDRSFEHHKGEEEKKESIETTPSPSTNMYEALWTNGPKENIEFFDYTFEDHFGKGSLLQVYMPRQPLLDYMLGRVTMKCPDFMDKYIQFNTNVEFVRYEQSKSKFEVTIKRLLTGETATQEYDYCIWAAGENGLPMMPQSMVEMFREGGFQGRIIHSSDTTNFEKDVRGKRVLLIGGSYSAEDLALMAVKVGAEKVFVSTRDDDSVIGMMGAWPYGKVEVLMEQIPIAVTEEGTCIQFAETEWVFPDTCLACEDVETELHDIDTIIFCTGYLQNMNMLDEELREKRYDHNLTLSAPKEWKMKPNKFTAVLGDVEPGDVYWVNSPVAYPGLYRGISIKNPKMMFFTRISDSPLTEIDVTAWLLLRFITGQRKIPSKEEMMKENIHDAMLYMDNPSHRYWMDKEYHDAFNDKFPEVDSSELLQEQGDEFGYDVAYRFIARSMQEAEYSVSYGTLYDLNNNGKAIYEYDSLSDNHRKNITKEDAENGKTFRDCDDSEKFRSLFTGATSAPLKCKWLDIDESDDGVLQK